MKNGNTGMYGEGLNAQPMYKDNHHYTVELLFWCPLSDLIFEPNKNYFEIYKSRQKNYRKIKAYSGYVIQL